MQTIFKPSETCPGICTPREIYNSDDPQTRKWPTKLTLPEGVLNTGFGEIRDNLDFLWCSFCVRIYVSALVQCPSCSRFFRGPRRFFLVNYECEDCE